MKNQANMPTVERKKVVLIIMLLVTSIAIIFLGAFFSVINVINNISFTILNSQIHGVIVLTDVGIANIFAIFRL